MKERLRSAVLAERRASVDQITALYTDETTEQLQINGQILINLCLSMDGSLFRNKKFRSVDQAFLLVSRNLLLDILMQSTCYYLVDWLY